MKSKAINALFVLGIVALISAPVLAGPTGPAYQVSMSGSGYGFSGLNGGAFTATPLNGGADWSDLSIGAPFLTFCAEPNVMGFGGWATIDNEIYFAGSYPNGVAVPASVRNVLARWFTEGYAGVGLTNDATGNMLLQAFVWKEIYGTLPNTAWNTFYTTNALLLSNLETMYGTAHARAGDIRVMNLWTSATLFDGTTDRQSQFVIVPAPAALLLGLMGLSTAARLRRKA